MMQNKNEITDVSVGTIMWTQKSFRYIRDTAVLQWYFLSLFSRASYQGYTYNHLSNVCCNGAERLTQVAVCSTFMLQL